MRAFVFIALLVASVSAIPQSTKVESGISLKQQRLVTDAIASLIEDLIISIQDAGLDPLEHSGNYEWALAVPAIFSSSAYLEDVRSTGLSNIVINRLNFATLAARLNFDIELPRIEASVGGAGAEVSFFGTTLDAQASGSVVVSRIRIVGEVRISIGIISGISIRSLTLDFSLGGIESDLNVVVLGNDISEPLNNLLGSRIPTALNDFRPELNELLEIIVLDILNDIL